MGLSTEEFLARSNSMKWVVASVLCGLIGSFMVMASEPNKGDQPVEDLSLIHI